MDKWSSLIRARAAHREPITAAAHVERITTSCLEHLVDEINARLLDYYANTGQYNSLRDIGRMDDTMLLTPFQALNAVATPNDDTLSEIHAPTLYPCVLMMVAQAILEHDKTKPKAQQMLPTHREMVHEISTYMDHHTDYLVRENFIARHQQLALVGLGDADRLKQFIELECRELINDAILGKPSQRRNEPPKGHSI